MQIIQAIPMSQHININDLAKNANNVVIQDQHKKSAP